MINVLQIDTAADWRGGQQQAFYLHKYLTERKITSLMFTQKDSLMEKKCLSEGLPYVSSKICGEWDFISVIKIVQICKANNIKVLNCHDAHSVTLGILAKMFYKKLKVIAVRRVDFHISNKLKYNTSFVDSIVCVSKNIKDILISDGIKEEKIVVIYDGIDTERFKSVEELSNLRNEFDISESTIVIGTIAAFVGHKDYYNFIDAAKLVLDNNEYVKFVAVGEGELLEIMKNKAAQLRISNKVIFTGYRKDVGALLKLFDIFTLASKKEGLGTSILDAQSVGLPVVATRAGGIPEIIENGVNGILVDNQNPRQLASAIEDLLNDKNKRNLIGTKALETVKKFDINITVNRNLELYQNLLKDENIVD